MNKRNIFSGFNIVPVFLCAIVLFVSCISDDMGDCPVFIRFNFSYNTSDVNQFDTQADKLYGWVFDADGRFVEKYADKGPHIDNSYSMELSGLTPGRYTMVVWSQGDTAGNGCANSYFPVLTPGVSTIDDLNPRLMCREGNIADVELSSHLTGSVQFDYNHTGPVKCTVDMIKCSNKIHILLKPVGNQEVIADDYDFLINDDNRWLNYRGEKYVDDEISYKPYHTETHHPARNGVRSGNTGMATASISVSRLFYVSRPSLRVVKKKTGEEMFVLDDLTWYLALIANLEHRDRWTPQEYLDREDYFDIMIYVNQDSFMKNKIVIKGWEISINDDINLNGI